MTKVLISVIGPTAIGKTRLAIILANHFNTEIISADSRQFYKEMTIGTAVPSSVELATAPHHFIQHKSVHEEYTVGDFENDAITTLESLFETKDIVVMAGGSGLYVDAVTKGLDSFPKIPETYRAELNTQFYTEGIEGLQKRLLRVDPVYYAKVDLQNPHRLIRALEVSLGTGKPYSSFLNQPKPERKFKVLPLGIHADRMVIYERINKRVDQMMGEGLLAEAEQLYGLKTLNALQTVGYQELFAYLDGGFNLEQAISEIKKNTRRFAKRQITWFKKNEQTLWIDHDHDAELTLKRIQKTLDGFQKPR